MRIGFIGAGKVGFTLGNIFVNMVLKLQAIIAAAFNRQAKRQNSRPQTSTPDETIC